MDADVLAAMIRQSSQAGRLIGVARIKAAMADQPICAAAGATAPDLVGDLIGQVLTRHDDIDVIGDGSGDPWYFSRLFMTDAYAQLLLLKGQGPLAMMAEVIREHSRVYPRPVPLALFQCAPFDLSDDQIRVCLEQMRGKPAYQDIAHLTTSAGQGFAYSTEHLDAGYAALLAEWADRGQAENP